MKALNKISNLLNLRWLMPVSGGVVIAFASAFILRQSLVWSGLVVVGLTVGLLSLMAKDFRTYWLAIYALVLPLDIKKLLVDSEYLRATMQLHGMTIGELPAPVLYLCDMPLFVLMGVWIYDIVLKKQKIIFPKSNWMALAFLAWGALSSINTTVLSYTFFDLIKWFKLYLLYLYVANNIRSRETVRVLVFCLLLGVIVQALFCVYQYVSQDITPIFGNLFGKSELFTESGALKNQRLWDVSESGNFGLKRASGTIGHSNSQARYFEFLLPVALILYLKSSRFRNRAFLLMTLILGLLGLIVTFSRGGFIGLAVGFTIIILLARWVKLISGRKFFALTVIGLAITIVFIPFIADHILTRPQSTLARLYLSWIGFDMIKQNPILGGGLNNHMILKSEFDLNIHGFYFYPVHNYFLIIATEVGIPGLAFFLGFLTLTFMLAYRAAHNEDVYLAAIAIGIFGALAAVSFHALVYVFPSYIILHFLWLFAGLAAALNTMNLKSS